MRKGVAMRIKRNKKSCIFAAFKLGCAINLQKVVFLYTELKIRLTKALSCSVAVMPEKASKTEFEQQVIALFYFYDMFKLVNRPAPSLTEHPASCSPMFNLKSRKGVTKWEN
jgi:hypothetical protein